MATSYEGRVRIGDATVTAKIGDVDDPGWLGQIASDVPVENFEPGSVTVELLAGDREGWIADAYLDTAGALRGESAFRRGE